MRIFNNLKKKEEMKESGTVVERDAFYICGKNRNMRVCFLFGLTALVGVCFLLVGFTKQEIKDINLSEVAPIQLAVAPQAATASRGVISIPSGVVKANPFVPYRDLSASSKVHDVPEYDLVEPPESLNESSDAARVMDTIVSGILFDKYNPSAILNIEGNDYLVKKGDVINNYQIVNISQDSVTVKLGVNVYKAGIGEILTEGTLNHNNVSNLNNKFGGKNNEIQ